MHVHKIRNMVEITRTVKDAVRLPFEKMARATLPKGYELDTEIFVNMECRVVIGLFEKDDDKNPGQMFRTNFVSDFLPARHAAHAEAF